MAVSGSTRAVLSSIMSKSLKPISAKTLDLYRSRCGFSNVLHFRWVSTGWALFAKCKGRYRNFGGRSDFVYIFCKDKFGDLWEFYLDIKKRLITQASLNSDFWLNFSAIGRFLISPFIEYCRCDGGQSGWRCCDLRLLEFGRPIFLRTNVLFSLVEILQ